MKNLINRFKKMTKLSKAMVIYAILVFVYEVIKAIIYVKSFVDECSMYGEKFSDYLGYVINGILDSYVVVPAGLILIGLLCVKIIESNRQQPKPFKEEESATQELEDNTTDAVTEEAIEDNTTDAATEKPAEEETIEEDAQTENEDKAEEESVKSTEPEEPVESTEPQEEKISETSE